MLAKVQFVCAGSKQVRFSIVDVTAIDPIGSSLPFDTTGISIVVSAGATIVPAAASPVQPRVPFEVDIRVGDPKAVAGLYGISFKLKSDQAQCMYVDGSAAPGGFLGADALSFVRTIDRQSVDMSITKTSAPGSSGSGSVGKMQFVCSNTGDLTFSVYDVVAVDQNGAALAMNPLTLTIRASMTPTTTVIDERFTPSLFVLDQNYPNPFNPSTTILFSLPSRSFVSLKIFDVKGCEVATVVSEEMAAGNYSRQWNADGLPSGVYFYRLQAGSFTESKRLILLR